MKQIKRDINGTSVEVKIYTSKRVRTGSDKKLDENAETAVRSAINKAKVCKQPIAKYDSERKRPYIEYPNGEKVYD